MPTRRSSRGGSTRSRRGPSKAVRWITSTLAEFLTAAGVTVVFDALGALTVAEKLEIRRIVRVHFWLRYKADSNGMHVHGRYGLIKANDDAIATGAGSLPSPILDADQSWMANEFYASERTDQNDERRLDIRSSRLVQPGTSLAFILQADAASDSSVHWSVGMRLLLEHR